MCMRAANENSIVVKPAATTWAIFPSRGSPAHTAPKLTPSRPVPSRLLVARQRRQRGGEEVLIAGVGRLEHDKNGAVAAPDADRHPPLDLLRDLVLAQAQPPTDGGRGIAA